MSKTESDSQTSRTNLWWTLFFFRQGFTVTPARADGEWGETTSPLLTHWGALSLFLIWGEGGVYPGGSAGRLPLGGLPSPPCRGHAQYPAFAPNSCFCSQFLAFAPNSLFLLPTPCFPSRVFRSSSRFLFLFCLFVSWFFLHSVGLDKPIMTCLRHYSIIQKIVTAQTILCAPSILPDPWPLLIFLLSS